MSESPSSEQEALDINNCKCGSFAIQSLSISLRGQELYRICCFNDDSDGRTVDCFEQGPECADSDESIKRWNAGERNE